MSGAAKFSITTDVVGHGRVEVNGEDVSGRVTGVAVVAELGQATVVTLRHVGGTAEISGEGIVKVRDDADSLVAFLDDIDVKELERLALDRLDMGSGTPIAEALELLKEWARGS